MNKKQIKPDIVTLAERLSLEDAKTLYKLVKENTKHYIKRHSIGVNLNHIIQGNESNEVTKYKNRDIESYPRLLEYRGYTIRLIPEFDTLGIITGLIEFKDAAGKMHAIKISRKVFWTQDKDTDTYSNIFGSCTNTHYHEARHHIREQLDNLTQDLKGCIDVIEEISKVVIPEVPHYVISETNFNGKPIEIFEYKGKTKVRRDKIIEGI